jgi:hypothetical protein
MFPSLLKRGDEAILVKLQPVIWPDSIVDITSNNLNRTVPHLCSARRTPVYLESSV